MQNNSFKVAKNMFVTQNQKKKKKKLTNVYDRSKMTRFKRFFKPIWISRKGITMIIIYCNHGNSLIFQLFN